MNPQGKPVGWLALIVLTLVWGTTFPFIKIAVNSIGFAWYVALRFSLASLILAPIAVLKKRRELLDSVKYGAVLGILFFGGITLQGLGMEYTAASNAGFITGLSVVMVYAIEVLLGREKPSIRLSTAVLLSVAGLYLLSASDTIHFNIGDLIVLAGAVFWALQVIAVGTYSRQASLIPLLFYEGFFTALGGLTLAVPTGIPAASSLMAAAYAIAYLAVFCTIVANTLQLYGQRFVKNVDAALIYLLEPVFAALFSHLILGEEMGLRRLAGAAAIVGAMAVSSTRQTSKH